jgi:hypothetical protein
MSREITSHQCGHGMDEQVRIEVVDGPGPGGACHAYDVWHPAAPEDGETLTEIRFQKGPIDEAGPNGISIETLLAICADRLAGFQSGAHHCIENHMALDYVLGAMNVLKYRTEQRVERGVEGTDA